MNGRGMKTKTIPQINIPLTMRNWSGEYSVRSLREKAPSSLRFAGAVHDAVVSIRAFGFAGGGGVPFPCRTFLGLYVRNAPLIL